MIISKINQIVWILGGVVSLTCGASAQFKPARPQQQQSVAPPVVQPQNKPASIIAPNHYSQILIKYLSNVKNMTNARNEKGAENYRQTRNLLQEEDKKLSKRQLEVLESLRQAAKTRPNKILDFPDNDEYNIPEYQALLPNSDTSALIFSSLIHEKIVSSDRLLDLLDPKFLNPKWINLLQELRSESPPDSTTRKKCLILLGRSGVDNSSLDSELKDLITHHQDIEALDALLFAFDSNNGMPKAKISQENLNLVKQLAIPQSSPEIQQLCAQYCAFVNDYDLAQTICMRLLSQKYKDSQSPEILNSDAALFRARSRCLALMFYHLQNEKMFKIIYDRSEKIADEAREQASLSLTKRTGYAFSTFGKLEVNFAITLVKSVDKWQ